jgi:hypothetical protein
MNLGEREGESIILVPQEEPISVPEPQAPEREKEPV